MRHSQRLCIIDPGMMEAGGHHAAFAEALISDHCGFDVVYYCSEFISAHILERMLSAGFIVKPILKCNFYDASSITDTSLSDQALLNIEALSKDYQRAFEDPLCEHSVCFYPSLDWQHAIALNAVLDKAKSSLQHIVSAMYKLGVDSNGDVYDATTATHVKASFSQLSQYSNVKLCAVDYASKLILERLIPNSKLLICPSYLAPWRSIAKRNVTNQRYLMYIGDVKEEKGFNDLPNLFRFYKRILGPDSKFIVQFTWNWDIENSESVRRELHEIAASDSQLEVYQTYWPTSRLAEEFASIESFICGYDTDTYRYKTSGLAWWLGFYDIPIIGRKPESILKEIKYINTVAGYREAIFGGFSSWIKSLA